MRSLQKFATFFVQSPLPSTTTSTCDDPSAHGTISSSTAPLHLPKWRQLGAA